MHKAFFLLVISAAALMINTPVAAGPGHDHGDSGPTAASNAPKREADGSVFLPKPSQRQLGIRTQVATQSDETRAVELPARVVLDAVRGGRVQPTQAGRLAPGARGMPQPGQRVTKGEVLAYVVPAVGALDIANQRASAAEAQATLEAARKRLARLTQLEGSVPQREIDDARIQLTSAESRATSVGGSLTAREALVAPVTGIVAGVAPSAIAGQVVDAREVLFEITDPASLTIEAVAFDAAMVADITAGRVAKNGVAVPLVFVGASRSLREGQIPLVFRASFDKLRTGSSGRNAPKGAPNNEFPVFAIGEAVTVTALAKSTTRGIAIPRGALVKNPSNLDTVWVTTEPEHYVPRVVRVVPLDGARVLVQEGVKEGERVVTLGATLINQVR